MKEEATSPRACASLTRTPASGEPQAEAAMEGRDQGEAGASRVRVYARVRVSLSLQLAAR